MTRTRRGAPRRPDDRGAVAAEFAVVLPAVVLVLLLGAGALAAGSQQVRLQDAVADAARLSARGEPERAPAVVAAAVPGASVTVEPDGDVVCVSASGPALLGLRVTASSCALGGGR